MSSDFVVLSTTPAVCNRLSPAKLQTIQRTRKFVVPLQRERDDLEMKLTNHSTAQVSHNLYSMFQTTSSRLGKVVAGTANNCSKMRQF
jgi:hypothetical protein